MIFAIEAERSAWQSRLQIDESVSARGSIRRSIEGDLTEIASDSALPLRDRRNEDPSTIQDIARLVSNPKQPSAPESREVAGRSGTNR